MSYTTLDFTAFLETVQPFDRLPVEVRRSLGQKLQPFRYEMGNAILKCDRLDLFNLKRRGFLVFNQ